MAIDYLQVFFCLGQVSRSLSVIVKKLFVRDLQGTSKLKQDPQSEVGEQVCFFYFVETIIWDEKKRKKERKIKSARSIHELQRHLGTDC